MNSKTILYIAIAVIAIAIIGIAAYAIFGHKTTTVVNGGTGTLPTAGNQSGGAGQNNGTSPTGNLGAGSGAPLAKNFGVVANDPVLAYFVDAQNNAFIIEPDGKIGEVTNSQLAMLNSLAIQNIIGASFSYDGKKALVNFGDPQNPQTSIFDMAIKSWAPLPTGLQSPRWSPSDYRIGYTATNSNGTQTVATLDAAHPKNQPVTLTSVSAQDFSVAWLNKTQIILYEKPSAYAAGTQLLFDLQKQSFAPIAAETLGLETAWSGNNPPGYTTPVGLAFSVGASQIGGRLQLVNTSGKAIQSLNFLTLPSKCMFHNESPVTSAATGTAQAPFLGLYCAVPRDQQKLSFSHLPDDYEQMSLFTSDDFYRVNVSDGSIATVFIAPSGNLDASNLTIANNTLFFVNRYDEKLYAMQL